MGHTVNYRAVVFLDRDGVINEDRGYVHTIDFFELLPGVVDSLKKLQELDCCVLIVSNQSGIARGYYTLCDLEKLQMEIDALFKTLDVKVQGFYYCPDLDSPNRKPSPGMLQQALNEHFQTTNPDLPLFMVGDKFTDIEAGKAMSCHCILIPNPDYPIHESEPIIWDATAKDLYDAVEQIASRL